MTYFVMDALCRLSFSVLFVYLFEAVADNKNKIAYIYTGALILLWYASQLLKMSANIYTLASKIKAGLLMLLYTKISKLNSSSIKSEELGKITNMLSNDLGVIEHRLFTLIFCTSFPIILIGVTVILIVRIGWVGIIGVVMVVFVIFISRSISEQNGEILKDVNIHKDRRV